jgi:hypothetical protein
MRFTLKGPFKENIYTLMRKAGYHLQGKNEEKSEFAFSRPARGYPRFHIYLETKGQDLFINLHLDQKKPIYKGVPAHSADYKGKTVEEEKERIEKIVHENSHSV